MKQPSLIKTSYDLKEVPKIVVNGRIAPSKFLLEILYAMKTVWIQMPNVQLHIFGAAEPKQAEYMQTLEININQEVNKRIFFHGLNFEVAHKFANYDAYIVLGKHQGCPNVLLEAMIAGLPCIANDSGGTREQIIDGKTGVLIEDLCNEEIAKALIQILSDRSFAEKLGKAARKHVISKFSMNKMVASYTRLLSSKWQFSLTPMQFNLRRAYYELETYS